MNKKDKCHTCIDNTDTEDNKVVTKRKNDIDKWIDKTFNVKHGNIAKSCETYMDFVYNDHTITLNQAKMDISVYAQSVVLQASKKNRLDYWIKRNIPEEYYSTAKSALYDHFIESGDIAQIDSIKEQIKKEVDELLQIHNRHRTIFNALSNHDIENTYLYNGHLIGYKGFSSKLGFICELLIEDYIYGDIEFEETVNKVVRYYKNYDKVKHFFKMINQKFCNNIDLLYNFTDYDKMLTGEIPFNETTSTNLYTDIQKKVEKENYLRKCLTKKGIRRFRKTDDYKKYMYDELTNTTIDDIVKPYIKPIV